MERFFQKQSDESLDSIYEEIITTCYTSKSSDVNIQLAKEELKQIIQKCSFNIDNVIENVRNIEGNESSKHQFISIVESHRTELLHSALLGHNASTGQCLTNFDWNLKLVLGTSESKSVRFPLLQLRLNSIDKNCVTQCIAYDLKKDMVMQLINKLENVIE